MLDTCPFLFMILIMPVPMTSLAFEIIPPDFDGGTDATDHRIAWVEAPSIEVVKAALKGTQARISP